MLAYFEIVYIYIHERSFGLSLYIVENILSIKLLSGITIGTKLYHCVLVQAVSVSIGTCSLCNHFYKLNQ